MTAPVSAVRLFNPYLLPPAPGRLTPSQVQAQTQLRELPPTSPVRTAMSAPHAQVIAQSGAAAAAVFLATTSLKEDGTIRSAA